MPLLEGTVHAEGVLPPLVKHLQTLQDRASLQPENGHYESWHGGVGLTQRTGTPEDYSGDERKG